MNRISALVVCAALALPVQAIAQDANSDANATTNSEAGTDAADANWQQFNEDLQAFAASDIYDLSADSDIEVVPLSSLTEDGGDNRDEYTVSIPANPEDIGEVIELLATNSTITSALEEAGYASDDVANIWVNNDGSLTIFVNDEDTGEAENPA